MANTRRLLAMINELRVKVEDLEARNAQQTRDAPTSQNREVLTRVVSMPGSAGGFDRVYTCKEQDDIGPASGDVGKDEGFNHLGVLQTDRDSPPQNYCFDVMLAEFGQHKIMMPQPHRLIAVLDVGSGGSFAGSRLGRYADIADASVSGFRSTNPIMFAQLSAQMVDSTTLPTKTGNVYPGFHAWPYPGMTLPGVTERDGFFICFLQAPGDPISPDLEVSSNTISVSSGTLVSATLKLVRDGQGNVLDAEITLSASAPI